MRTGYMKTLSVVVGLLAVGSTVASATPIIATAFCPQNATCPAGVTEASIVINADTATLDANDYFLNVTIAGNSTAPAYLDEFSFAIDGVKTPDGYAALPTLFSSSTDQSWTPFFDNISASSDSCSQNTGSSQEVCTQSVGNFGAALPGQTLTFSYYIDLAGTFQILPTTGVNLRAQFLNANGSNAGILSPDGNGDPLPSVPEPASMILLGSGLVGIATSVRRRRKAVTADAPQELR